jgi:6,7-dimethyl-8-ribityllumazine synthase
MKHRAFQAEAEWRAVSAAHHDFVKGPGASIRYRVGQSMLVPYIAFRLANSSGVIPIDTVITGPTPHPERASESIQRLVARHMKGLHGPWKSQYCQIPFRAW